MPEIVQTHVVGTRVAPDVRKGIFFRHPLHPASHDYRQLSLVVEELRPPRAPDHAAVPVQGRGRLEEVRGLRRRARSILLDAAQVGQVDGHDLRGFDRSEVVRPSLRDTIPRIKHDLLALAHSPLWRAITQHAHLPPNPDRPARSHISYPNYPDNPTNGYIIHRASVCQECCLLCIA